MKVPQNHCLDKGPRHERGPDRCGEGPVPEPNQGDRRGEEAPQCRKGHTLRRWVVNLTIGRLNKCRAILVRYDKKAENDLGLTKLACALIRWRRLCYLLS